MGSWCQQVHYTFTTRGLPFTMKAVVCKIIPQCTTYFTHTDKMTYLLYNNPILTVILHSLQFLSPIQKIFCGSNRSRFSMRRVTMIFNLAIKVFSTWLHTCTVHILVRFQHAYPTNCTMGGPSLLCRVQPPQCFRFKEINKSFQ